MARMSRRSRYEPESLEGRRLMNARIGHLHPSALVAPVPTPGVFPNPLNPRFLSYTTGDGAQVTIGVRGSGNLLGSGLDPDGALNLRFTRTNAATKIDVRVRGGSAPLRSLRDAGISQDNVIGVGGHLLGTFVAPGLDLVDGGNINLSSGIGRLQLRSIGRDTQVHLRELPQTVQSTTSNANSALATNTGGVLGTTTGSQTGNISVSPSIPANGTGTAVITGSNSVLARAQIPPGDQAVAIGLPYTQFAPATYTTAGKTQTYTNDANGGSTLQSVTGTFTPTLNLITTPDVTNPGTPPAPPGVMVQVGQINAGTPGTTTIGDGEIFGYDPTLNALVRFDARSGANLGSIPVGGAATSVVGVGLGRNGREEVVLLARGATVQAFDVVTGAAVGQFSAANVFGTPIDGVAFLGTTTVLTSSTAMVGPNSGSSGGLAAIDVTASLASGLAVPLGQPFASGRGFFFNTGGGATGVTTALNAYVLGEARFDPYRPDQLQFGILTVAPASTFFRETARTAVPNQGNVAGTTPFIPFGPITQVPELGSVENRIALDSGVVNGKNVVTFYNPNAITPAGSVALNDANLLAGLSESFHPELAGSALIDVQGNVQSFNVGRARGLALNDSGNLNLVKILDASDSSIVGQPVGHLILIRRNNVVVVSPTRSVGDRQAVIVDPGLRPLGPLVLPS